MRIDYDAVLKATQIAGIKEDLADIGLSDPQKIASCFVNDERTLRGFLGDGPINTEDTPFIEFESPRHGYGPEPLKQNMSALYALQVPARDRIDNAPEAALERIDRLQRANAILFEGHAYYRDYKFTESCERYLAAKAIVPDDTSIDALLNYVEFRQIIDRAGTNMDSNVYWLAQSLSAVYLMQKRYADVVTVAESAVANLPPPETLEQGSKIREAGAALYSSLADAYDGAGQPEKAKRYRAESEKYR